MIEKWKVLGELREKTQGQEVAVKELYYISCCWVTEGTLGNCKLNVSELL